MFKFVPKDQNILQIHFDIFKNIFLAEGHTIDGEWLLSQQLTHTHTHGISLWAFITHNVHSRVTKHFGHPCQTSFTKEDKLKILR